MTTNIDEIPPDLKKAWKESEQFFRDIFNNNKNKDSFKIDPLNNNKNKDSFKRSMEIESRNGRYIHDGQPGTGKTLSLAKIIKETENQENPPSIAFFSSNHAHIDKFKKDDLKKVGIKKSKFIHGKGFERACKRLIDLKNKKEKWTEDEQSFYTICTTVKTRLGEILCVKCKKSEDCEYYKYKHKSKDYRITLQPLEFLSNKYNDDKDIFVVDEAVSKERKIHWYYTPEIFKKFIENIEAISNERYELRDYEKSFLDFHKSILKEVSSLFKEKPEDLFAFCSQDKASIFQSRKDFSYDPINKRITHPGEIKFELLKKSYELQTIKEGYYYYINDQIRKAFDQKDHEKITELMKNYFPLRQNLDFLDILIQASCIKKCAFLVHEKLDLINNNIERMKDDQTPVKENKTYKWGFIGGSPYLLDKRYNRAIISKIGETYEEKGKSDKKAWFTIGQPYLYWVFNKSRNKPVIVLDATYRKLIFKTLYQKWRKFQTFHEFDKDRNFPLIYYTQYKINIQQLSRRKLKYKKTEDEEITLIYNAKIRGKGSFPKSSKESNLPKILGTIITFIEENPKKSFDIIAPEGYRKKIQEQLKKYLKNNKLETYHYNQRGKTLNVDMLFIVTTPYIPPIGTIFKYVLTFTEYPESTKEKPKAPDFKGYEDKLLDEIFNSVVLDEIYQEIHRNRGFQHNRLNVVFALMPIEIRLNEFDVIDFQIDTKSGEPEYKMLDYILENDNKLLHSRLYQITRNQGLFERVGGSLKVIEDIEKKELIASERKSTKGRHGMVYSVTKKGRKYYRERKTIFG